MRYVCTLPSPLGTLTLRSDGEAITALTPPIWRRRPEETGEVADLPIFRRTAEWLEKYFTGTDPGPIPSIRPCGTPYQLRVWATLVRIPIGVSVTYGDIARMLNTAELPPSSPRAVGGAVGRNPIAILIPCHRVLGAGGALTGFGGGMDAKRFLLELEGIPYRKA